MDTNTKDMCKRQLQMLAESFASKDGKELSLLILQTCASLMGVIEKNTPTDSSEEKELKELTHGYSLIYYVMNPFLEKAAKAMNLEETQKLLENTKTMAETLRSLNGGLVGEYENAVKELERLEKIKAEYTPEKLAMAEEACATLTEETEVLTERHELINRETAECLEKISASLGILGEHLDSQQEQAQQVRKTADDFKNGITVLEKVYEDYTGWFHVLETPAQKFVQEVGQAEMEKLRGVMDEKRLIQTNALVRDTKSNLEALEKIVKAGARASQSDYNKIVECAGK